ncbi:MAG TPA: class C sortase [Clostridiales bacterium]|nr:class C sortase [Clostridiales bacterium]
MTWMKKNWTVLLLAVVFLLGLCLLLYPSVSNYVNTLHSTRVISAYEEALSKMTPEDYSKELEAARAYNAALARKHNDMVLTDAERAEYTRLLDLAGMGVMGYIEIEKLNVSLPIYHGTAEEVLQEGVGHLEWSSLPVGGESTHAVISGHRGLPSAKLFTKLDKLAEGDTFVLHVLNETLTYEVDQILIVDPDDVSSLGIADGKDYVTLVTCTPYGINTHRLLVRGHRVSNLRDAASVPADGIQLEPEMMAPLIAAPLLLGLLLYLVVATHKKKKQNKVFHEAMKHTVHGMDEEEFSSLTLQTRSDRHVTEEKKQPKKTKQKTHRKKGKNSETKA